MSIKRITTCFLLVFPFWVFGQYAGNYTIGGSNPNFSSITSALNAMKIGTTDTVFIDVMEGEYLEDFDVSYVDPNHPVIFRNPSLPTSLVVFKSTGINFSFSYSKNLYFENIFFEKTISQGITMGHCENIGFKSCILNTNTSTAYAISSSPGEGKFEMVNCHVMQGKVDISGYPTVTLENNIFKGQVTVKKTSSLTVESNTFYDITRLSGFSKVSNNLFKNDCSTSFARYVHFFDNKFEKDFRVSSSDHVIVERNVVQEYFATGSGDHIKVVNNHFHYISSISRLEGTHDLIYSFNNHGVNSYVQSVFQDGHLYSSNNFSQPIFFLFGSPEFDENIYNNNYYPGYGTNGFNSFHIDPQYESVDDLNSLNPLLAGKGIYSSSVSSDMDGQFRSSKPTIGANEVCNSMDTISLFCGEDIQLKSCEVTHNNLWFANGMLIDSTSSEPIVSPVSSQLYYLVDSMNNPVDSIFVEVLPFQLELIGTDSTRCGFYGSLLFSVYPSDDVSYSWFPEDSILNFGNFSWYANPESTTNYILNAEHPTCGIFSDTTEVKIDPIPFAYMSLLEIENVVEFTNLSYCADSVIWIFGDGESSEEWNPIHIYDTTGVIPFFLIAINAYGRDTLNSFVVVMMPVGTEDIVVKNRIELIPNPSSGVFYFNHESKIENLEIFNIMGENIPSRYRQNNKKVEIELMLPNSGNYYCRFRSMEGVFIEKFQVIH